MDNYNKFVQYGVIWTETMAIVDVPVRKLPLKPTDCFQNITALRYYTLEPFSTHSSTENCGLGCDVHQPSSYSSSAFCSIRLFQFLVSLIVKH